MIQKSYVMIKPDFANNPEIIEMVKSRLIAAGFKIISEGFVLYTPEAAKAHYSELIDKPFYPPLENYITSDVAYGIVVEGENAINIIHGNDEIGYFFMGKTSNPAVGSIRYEGFKIMGYLDRDPKINGRENVAHSSDSPEAAEKEIEIYEDLRVLNTQKSL